MSWLVAIISYIASVLLIIVCTKNEIIVLNWLLYVVDIFYKILLLE